MRGATCAYWARTNVGQQCVNALTIMRAFLSQEYFIEEAARRCDVTNAAVFNAETLNLWLAFWCDFIGACLVGVVSAFAVGLKGGYRRAITGMRACCATSSAVCFDRYSTSSSDPGTIT